MSSTNKFFDRSSPPVIDYPESDGLPMGETDWHIDVIAHLRYALRVFFAQDPSTYVAANMMFYYEEGNPRAVCSPDVFVVRGVAKHKRRTFKLWNEAPPVAIFEVNSRSTTHVDRNGKHALYMRIGVPEYFQFDPLGEYVRPQLRGFRLVEGAYRPISPAADGSISSAELGLILSPRGDMLRLIDPSTGKMIPSGEEFRDLAAAEAERAAAEAERAAAEAERAAAASAEVARLRALLDELRGE